jgi:phosphoribosylformimino-5-aminoimidazole carboxamide ribotide isomerase
MPKEFIIFPAIDLHNGKVVRLKEGDLDRLTQYSDDPASTASHWLATGAAWLHVINLDGAFEKTDDDNLQALHSMERVAHNFQARVQFGGGLRSLQAIEKVIEVGVDRVRLGTAAVTYPEILPEALERWGGDRVAVSLDARDGMVRIRGWQEATDFSALELSKSFQQQGLRWLVFTDMARDGLQTGLNLPKTVEIARLTGLNVIASGGVSSNEDIQAAMDANLAGVIVGRALYEGTVNLAGFLKPSRRE